MTERSSRDALGAAPHPQVVHHQPSRSRWAAVAVLAMLAVAVAFVAVETGSAARSLQAGATVTQTSTETVAAFGTLGARGAVVLVATEDLGYSPVSILTTPGTLAWPVGDVDLAAEFAAGADRDSWLWVLAKTGVVRRIDYLLPQTTFERRVAEGRAQGLPGIARDGRSVLANDEGYLRYIAAEPRRLDTPLVVVVDASYFRTGTPAELATRLQQLDLVPTAVVLYRATEDTSVPEAARVALDGAIPGLEQVRP